MARGAVALLPRRRGAPRERALAVRRRARPGDRRPRVRTPAAWPRRTAAPDARSERRGTRRHAAARPSPAGKRRGSRGDREPEPEPVEDGTTELQVSWEPGRVVAWAGGPRAPVADRDQVTALLAAAGAPESGWSRHTVGAAARRRHAPTRWRSRSARCSAGSSPRVPTARRRHRSRACAGSGRVAIWAVELTARGAMVPLLRRRTRRSQSARESSGSYSVRWTPALVDADRLDRDGRPRCPARCARSIARSIARALTRSALTGMVDAICRDSARRLEVPAPPPGVRTGHDVAEAFLARLDGSAFDAPVNIGARDRRPDSNAGPGRSPAARASRSCSSIRPTTAARGTSWCFAPGPQGAPIAIEQAIVAGGHRTPAHRRRARPRSSACCRCCGRPGGIRRGQVILSADEAWDLMAATGPRLQLAGFDVRVPELSRRPSTPSLRIFVDAVNETAVGANQLANVRWSALFDDVELTAADIARLAKEARPLIRSGSRWIAIDRADLNAAADALAERDSDEAALRRGDAAPRARTRGLAARRRDLDRRRGMGGRSPRRGHRRQGGSRGRRPRASSASCAATRPRRSRGSASSTPPVSAAASRSTWASARRRRCSRTCSPASKTDPRW